jgi:hypothetical protein
MIVPILAALLAGSAPAPAIARANATSHSPDAFEGVRNCGPELVVDAIDAILQRLDGNGGSIVDGHRRRAGREPLP